MNQEQGLFSSLLEVVRIEVPLDDTHEFTVEIIDGEQAVTFVVEKCETVGEENEAFIVRASVQELEHGESYDNWAVLYTTSSGSTEFQLSYILCPPRLMQESQTPDGREYITGVLALGDDEPLRFRIPLKITEDEMDGVKRQLRDAETRWLRTGEVSPSNVMSALAPIFVCVEKDGEKGEEV